MFILNLLRFFSSKCSTPIPIWYQLQCYIFQILLCSFQLPCYLCQYSFGFRYQQRISVLHLRSEILVRFLDLTDHFSQWYVAHQWIANTLGLRIILLPPSSNAALCPLFCLGLSQIFKKILKVVGFCPNMAQNVGEDNRNKKALWDTWLSLTGLAQNQKLTL